MELTLENVGEEFARIVPSVTLIDEGDGVRVRTRGLWLVEALQIMYMGIDILSEDMTDEDKAELAAWFDSNRD